MDDVLVETVSGRIRPGFADKAVNSSRGKSWDGFFVRESGPVNVKDEDIILLKYAVSVQLNEPGHAEWRGDDRNVSKTIQPGQVSICPPNKLYSASFRHQGSHVSVFLEPRFLAAAMNNGVSPENIQLRWELGIDSPVLRELVMLLHAEATSPKSGDNYYAMSIARLIAMHLVQHYSTTPSETPKRGGLSPARLRKVMELIEEKLNQELSLDELAATAGLSVFHFSRVFRQSTGMSPFQCVMERRINRARSLLLLPSARIQDVALECGFCDQAHLTRNFKRITGVTPAAFVRNIGIRGISRTNDSETPTG